MWFRQSALALLSVSVVTFLAGLILYVKQSQRSVLMTWVVSGFVIFCLMGVSTVTFWFAWEGWLHYRERLEHQHTDLGGLAGTPTEPWGEKIAYWMREAWSRFMDFVQPITDKFVGGEELKERRERERERDTKGKDSEKKVFERTDRESEKLEEGEEAVSHARRLWNTALRGVTAGLEANRRKLVPDVAWELGFSKFSEPFAHPRVQDVLASYSGVSSPNSKASRSQSFRSITFSSSGDWLAAISKHGCSIFKMRDILKPNVGSGISAKHVLWHKHNDARQADWSPDGSRLLTRNVRNLKVWVWDDDEDEEDVRSRAPFE
jgi:hypothetical protein